MKSDENMRIPAIFNSSVFQDFESFLGTETELIEDDFRLVLDKYSSSFMTNDLEPGVYTFKDLTETLFEIVHPEYEEFNNSIDIELDDNTMKTKLVVRPGILAIRFDEKSVFSTILDFRAHWDYKHYYDNFSQKIINLSTTKNKHLNCDVIDGSVVDGSRQPIFFSFVSDKPSGYNLFCEPETIHYKKNKQICFENNNFSLTK